MKSTLLAALLCVLATGCFGSSKPVEFYTLRPSADAAGSPPTQRRLGIAVGPLQLPKYLDRPEIVTRDGEHGLSIQEDHRWAGSLRGDLLRVIADDLSRLLDTTYVAVYPVEPRFAADYRILFDVHEFEGTPGQSVRLRVFWSVLKGTGSEALAVELSDIEQPVASAEWTDFVAAHNAALATMSRQIAARIQALSATGRDRR